MNFVAAPALPMSIRLEHWFRNLSIRRKLAVGMVAPVTIGLLFSAIALVGYAAKTARGNALANLQSITEVMASNAGGAVAFADPYNAQEILSAFRHTAAQEVACLYSAEVGDQPKLLAAYPESAAGGCGPELGDSGTRRLAQDLISIKEITQAGARVGWLTVRQDQLAVRNALTAQVAITLAILVASVALNLLIGIAAYRTITPPLLGLARVARDVSQTRDYRLRAPKHGDDEVGRLVDDFNGMLEQIAQAQAQLVQSERMAALGGLVAGVAHEINTPVGVGVTAASTLRDLARQLGELYARGAMKRSDLEHFIAMANESAGITLKNLERAAALIASFKQVAVDQSSGERRRFRLAAYIDEVLVSLAPQWKKSGHAVLMECAPQLEVETYPGALAQILSNLVSNSLVHGYDPGERGRIVIQAGIAERCDGCSEQGDCRWIELRYRDDGKGIAPENLPRIFEPFFTTRRGDGGSGLGLNIVYNVAHQVLGGTIKATSEPGRGVEFVLRFPSVAPGAQP